MDLGIDGVDPVPGEIGDGDRPNAGVRGGSERERRNVAHDDGWLQTPQQRRFLSHALIEIRMEGRNLSSGCRLVDPKAVDLRDSWIDLRALHVDAVRACEQPLRRRRSHDESHVGRERADGAHQLDVARRVAVAVA